MAKAMLLTPAQHADLLRMLSWFRNGGGRRPGVFMEGGGGRSLRFEVTDPVPMEGEVATIGGLEQPVRWDYTLVQKRWDHATSAWVSVTDGLVVPGTNTWEDHNTDLVIAPGYRTATLPEGFALYPVGKASGGLSIKTVVTAWPECAENGDVAWKFWFQNSMDGVCPSMA